MICKLLNPVEARQVTIDTLDEVAKWAGGDVIGMRLPPNDRAVKFTNYDHDKREADVGMWIVMFLLSDGSRHGIVLQPELFDLMITEEGRTA